MLHSKLSVLATSLSLALCTSVATSAHAQDNGQVANISFGGQQNPQTSSAQDVIRAPQGAQVVVANPTIKSRPLVVAQQQNNGAQVYQVQQAQGAQGAPAVQSAQPYQAAHAQAASAQAMPAPAPAPVQVQVAQPQPPSIPVQAAVPVQNNQASMQPAPAPRAVGIQGAPQQGLIVPRARVNLPNDPTQGVLVPATAPAVQGVAPAAGAAAAAAASPVSGQAPANGMQAAPVNGAQPGFTFENQSTPSTNQTTGSVSVVPDSAAASQYQEVTVTPLKDFDSSILEGFRSLVSGLTLGLNDGLDKLKVSDVAPALKGFTTDANGDLVLKFDVNMAKGIMQKLGATEWKGLSNPVLLWMVDLSDSQNKDSLSLVSGQNLTAFAQDILKSAPEYKYRLMFPILDLEDVQHVKVNTVLDDDATALAQASQRYGADFFIAAAIDDTSSDGTVSLKWNLFDKSGNKIANSSLTGLMDEVASLGSGDIARALMQYQSENHDASTPSTLTQNNVDISMLGPGDGFVRLKLSNVNSLSDLNAIHDALSSYGYDGDAHVVGFDQGYTIIEVVTNSSPDNLAGSMRHSGDFTYLAPWTFSYNKSTGTRPAIQSSLGDSNAKRPNSSLNAGAVKGYTPRVSKPQGDTVGLPSRTTPAVQGAGY